MHNRIFMSLCVVAMFAGGGSTARAQEGMVIAWGDNSREQLEVAGPNSGYVAVSAGAGHALGMKADGSIYGWGDNTYGQVQLFPPINRGFADVSAGDHNSLALRSQGSIFAFGENAAGQTNVPAPNGDFVAIAAGVFHGLGLKSGGSVVAWDCSFFPDVCDVPAPNMGFAAISAGYNHSLGLKADGSIVAWGSGLENVPEPNAHFVAIAAGAFHNLALKADGSIVAWGAGGPGQSGELHWGQSVVPTPNTGFVAVAAGWYHSLGLKADGSIVAWGRNTSGECNVPAPNRGFVAIAAGQDFSLGLKGSAGGGCDEPADCSDGVYCNGSENCVAGSCVAGPGPCGPPLLCRESDDRCVSCLINTDCGDGLFCNGAETCSADGACRAGSNPCPGQACNESSDVCAAIGSELWLSFVDSASVPGVGIVADEDIVARNLASGTWSLVFDGSDVGLSGLVIDGLARLNDGSILLSFSAAGSIPGMTGGPSGTLLDDSDIVRFIPASLGANTAGSFAFYFDGSDVGLSTNDEDIDAIALTGAGQLVISTVGVASATGASGADTDLLIFHATSLGATTAGAFAVHFDGSDVGLSDAGNEDVDASGLRANGMLLLSTTGSASVPGLLVADEDVLQFTPTRVGGTTSGSYTLFQDLSALGIATSEDIGALEFRE